jgi:RNA polymerase sigma-70 factor (ECF subfamily)
MGSDGAARLALCFDAHAAQLALYARQWLSGGAAEDVVQEVFLKLLALSRPPVSVKAWLFKAVRNAAISELRSQRRRRKREQSVAEGRREWFEAAGGELIDARAAQEALEMLVEIQREVVVLRIWGGLTLAETAETVGLPLSTVYDHYRSALSAVRRVMEKRTCPNHRK